VCCRDAYVALWTFHGRRYGLEADGFGKFPSFLRCVTLSGLPSELIVVNIVVFLVLNLRNTAGTVIQGASSFG